MNNNNSIQSGKGTPIHTHNFPPLQLQGVGGTIRLGRKRPDQVETSKPLVTIQMLNATHI
jgi:hypothetical protein